MLLSLSGGVSEPLRPAWSMVAARTTAVAIAATGPRRRAAHARPAAATMR